MGSNCSQKTTTQKTQETKIHISAEAAAITRSDSTRASATRPPDRSIVVPPAAPLGPIEFSDLSEAIPITLPAV
jgi:hypothetical protein